MSRHKRYVSCTLTCTSAQQDEPSDELMNVEKAVQSTVVCAVPLLTTVQTAMEYASKSRHAGTYLILLTGPMQHQAKCS